MADIKALKTKRGNVKGSLTRFNTHLDRIDILNLNPKVITELEYRLADTETLLKQFNEIQYEIELISNDDPDIHNVEHSNFEEEYFTSISSAKQLISSFHHKDTISQVDNSRTNNGHFQPNMQNVKLPTIDLPKFSGFYDQWLEFFDIFNSLINENSSLSETQKFHYLKSSLTNEAAQVIKSLEVCAANYSIAWNLLRERFENKRLIIYNHVNALFELPSLHKESRNDLRQLFDNVSKNLRSLKSLGQPVEHWDTLIIHIIVKKLDSRTRREWEEFNVTNKVPDMTDMSRFLKNKCELLEVLNLNRFESKITNNRIRKEPNHTNSYLATNKLSCPLCKNNHLIYNCDKFLNLSINNRISEVKRLRLCLNCLKNNHFSNDCKASLCKTCNKKHNTLLHIERNNKTDMRSHSPQLISRLQSDTARNYDLASSSQQEQPLLSNCSFDNNKSAQILLSTASIRVKDARGNLQECRVLLDSGSQSNFLTEELCNRLHLSKNNIVSSVIGINQSISNIKHMAQVEIRSRCNAYKKLVSCLVLNKITEALPITSFDINSLNIPQNITLADPLFNKSNKIDMLLGASLFWELLCVGQIQLGNGLPTLQKTQLGWVVAGPFNYQNSRQFQTYLSLESANVTLEDQVAKFWSIEECNNNKPNLSKEELACEEYFSKTTTRAECGRFVVKIPFRENVSCLGNSRAAALKRFYNLERKLEANPVLKQEYVQFMREYEILQHMTKIDEKSSTVDITFYFPQHIIVKEHSLTTKVRVVFDGSVRTDTGLSLNDTQMVGPTIQSDLFSILLRFRKYSIVFSADITKMYRQILIDKNQRGSQRVLFRSDSSSDLECFELNTVTYGTASAPFLATRCLKQLAIENQAQYPNACDVIRNDFYIDDLLTGADNINDAIKIKSEVTTILSQSGFELHKWTSNNTNVLRNIQGDTGTHSNVFNVGGDQQAKTLGVVWNAKLDTLHYTIKTTNMHYIITKRSILSSTAQIFDPLGLLGPITIVAKLILQKLWQLKLSWDESIPAELHTMWTSFRDQLHLLNNVKISRHVACNNAVSFELHGFSDACPRAYGACVYLKSQNKNGKSSVHLLCAKSRVAPLRSETLPRLELCGAVLLSALVQKVREAIKLNVDRMFYWCDSTITLCWIKADSSRFKTFVSNRVSDIQKVSDVNDWRYIRSHDNPADLISRGVTPNELKTSTLWWHGPTWLANDISEWPIEQSVSVTVGRDNMPEMRKVTSFVAIVERFSLVSKISSLLKMQKILSYCLRFIHNCRNCKDKRQTGPITTQEVDYSLLLLVKVVQYETFSNEIQSLSKFKVVNSKSRLVSLNPFLDDKGILRVGGRLRNSKFKFDKKYPMVLPANHALTTLIMTNEHKRLLHCGAQLLLASIRERFWPLSGRNMARKIIHDCITCYRTNPKVMQYQMGDLPSSRITSAPPFYNCGLDYAGPCFIKDRRTRGAKLIKAYVCLFVCFATKAIHLELVNDLSTETFLAALRRFVARRGRPQNIYSDNATTFVGANAELKELYDFITASQRVIYNSLIGEKIAWHFIPPKSPNFGGLWEGGIKSMKGHLKRILGNAHLTFDDLYTTLTQIEAVLNSRPLHPLSSDPNDMNPLTPAHFLIGRPLTSLPDPNVTEIPENRLSRFQKLQQLMQHFWTRWNKEYISELQTRVKWQKSFPNLLKLGSLVVIREDNLPPLKWQLGRVIELHPGGDGVTRVATIKLPNSVVKRAVTKLCVLPIDST